MPFNPNPSFESKEDAQRAYIACGKVALYWGPTELTIENMLVLVRARQRAGETVFPVSFSKKIRELKDRLKSEAHFDEVRDKLRPLITRAKALHEARTKIVHSYFQGQRMDGTLMFGRSDRKNGVAYTDKDARFTVADLEQIATDMITLHDHFEPVAAELERIVFKNIPKI